MWRSHRYRSEPVRSLSPLYSVPSGIYLAPTSELEKSGWFCRYSWRSISIIFRPRFWKQTGMKRERRDLWQWEVSRAETRSYWLLARLQSFVYELNGHWSISQSSRWIQLDELCFLSCRCSLCDSSFFCTWFSHLSFILVPIAPSSFSCIKIIWLLSAGVSAARRCGRGHWSAIRHALLRNLHVFHKLVFMWSLLENVGLDMAAAKRSWNEFSKAVFLLKNKWQHPEIEKFLYVKRVHPCLKRLSTS